MSYRPYPSSKKSISYSSRHHLVQAYKPPVVRGYGSRSPYQTGAGVRDLPQATTTTLGGVKVDGTSIIATNGVISIAESKQFCSVKVSSNGLNPTGWVNLNLTQNGLKTSGLTINSQSITGLTVGTVYRVTGFMLSNLTTASSAPTDGMRIVDGVGTILECTTTVPTNGVLNPRPQVLSGFFTPVTQSISLQSANDTTSAGYENWGFISIESV